MPPYKPRVPLSSNDWLTQLRGLGSLKTMTRGINTVDTRNPANMGLARPSAAMNAYRPASTDMGTARPGSYAMNWRPGNLPVPDKKLGWKDIADRVTKGAADVVPYVSNIRNAFVKPPKPVMGATNDYLSLKRVNMNADRNAVGREVNANTEQAYRNLDANTAARVGMAGLGQKINAYSQISEREQNANTQIDNTEAMANAQIGQGNNAIRDQYSQDKIDRKIAMQTQQSGNWANAGQKAVEIGNEKLKGQVEIDKTKALGHAYDNTGTLAATRQKMYESGEDDPWGMDWKDMEGGVKRKPLFPKRYGGTVPTKRLR